MLSQLLHCIFVLMLGWQYSFKQAFHAVAYKKRVGRYGMCRETHLLQCMIGCDCKIVNGVEQRAVKVKDEQLFHVES